MKNPCLNCIIWPKHAQHTLFYDEQKAILQRKLVLNECCNEQ